MKKKEANRSLVKRKQINEAVKTLKEYTKKWDGQNASRKKPLLAEPSQTPILLNFTLKKIPELSSIKMIKVPLPHTLVTDLTEVCLITGDLDKRDTKAETEPTVQHYKELLSKHGITAVSEVIPLRQLRTEYKQHEAKRNLFGAYDCFLADNRIAQCLPRLLGRFFFKKRKFPQQINLATSNLKSQIENALSRTVFFLTGRGNSCCTEVAHLGFTTKQIVENIEAAINTLAANIPGTWKNINALYVKTPLSVSIPFYMSSESGNDVELPAPERVEDVEPEEITTVRGYRVKVCGDGNIELIKKEEPSSDDESDHESVETSSEETSSSDEDDHARKRRKLRRKKKMSRDVSDDIDADIDEEKTETLSRRKQKLKKKVKMEKTKSKQKKIGSDADIDEEETETLSRKKEKLKKKTKTEKTKSKQKKIGSDADIDEEETETLSRKKEKLKKKAKTEKTKSKQKKIGSDADIDEEETETLSRRKEKLKKKANMEKTKSVVKKRKKRSVDEINDDEIEIVKTKRKKKSI